MERKRPKILTAEEVLSYVSIKSHKFPAGCDRNISINGVAGGRFFLVTQN